MSDTGMDKRRQVQHICNCLAHMEHFSQQFHNNTAFASYITSLITDAETLNAEAQASDGGTVPMTDLLYYAALIRQEHGLV